MSRSFPSAELIKWFKKNQRSLPWRQQYKPYEVWLSEVMAQQTRIDQMIPYFKQFLKQFPSIERLAGASEQSVLKAWEGLGYYSRARNLRHAAKQIVSAFNGKLPESKSELEKLKGFGPYISSAVASIAFNENVPVVDGNVLRVFARVSGNKSDISKTETRKKFEIELQSILPLGQARNFNQGLMELGALICLPQNPLCNECPLKKSCIAFQKNIQNILPIKSKKPSAPTKHFAAFIIQKNNSFLLQQRFERLLNGLWEFPLIEFQPLKSNSSDLEKEISKKLKIKIKISKKLGHASHTYTHFKQEIEIFSANAVEKKIREKFFSLKEISSLPLPNVQRKILSFLK